MKVDERARKYLLEKALSRYRDNTMECKTSILDESFGPLAAVPPEVAQQLQDIISQAVAPLLEKINSDRLEFIERISDLEAEIATLKATSAPPAETAPGEDQSPPQEPPSPPMAILEEIIQLKTDLTGLNEANESRALEIATDRRRIAALETPPTPHVQPKQRNQGDILRALLAATGKCKMLQSVARRTMSISKSAFSRLLHTLDGIVSKVSYHRDRRQNVLTLINKKS